MDIRNFFKPVGSKSTANGKGTPENEGDASLTTLARKKRPQPSKSQPAESASNDEKKSRSGGKRRNRLAIFDSSDEEDGGTKASAEQEKPLKKSKTDNEAKGTPGSKKDVGVKVAPLPPAKKAINPNDFFGGAGSAGGKKRPLETDAHHDEKFKAALRETGTSTNAGTVSAQVAKEAKEREELKKNAPAKKIPKLDKKEDRRERSPSLKKKNVTPIKTPTSGKRKPIPENDDPPSKKKGSALSQTDHHQTPHRGKKDGESSDGDVVDKAPFSERKKVQSLNYQKYLHRGGPAHPGSKAIPEGEENCFKGLTFVVTGVMDSLQREEVEELAKKYGGRVAHTVSRNVSHMVVGVEPGPSKMKKAAELRIKQLNEDEFLALIVSKSEALRNENSHPVDDKAAEEKSLKSSHHDSRRASSGDPHKHKESKHGSVEEKAEKHAEGESKPSSSALHQNVTPDKPKEKIVSKPKAEAPKDEKKGLKPSTAPASAPAKKPVELADGSSVVGDQLWVDKYKPKSSKNIIGQQGDKSNATKLRRWLEDWHKNHGDPTKKVKSAPPWLKDEWGATFKAALLSGPPGVGKTTTALVVSQELGFDTVELNASDTRSKKALESDFVPMVSNQALGHTGTDKTSSRRVVIMDEVDGMAGNEDRGGVAELIRLIKLSRVPIICICNDRNHQKIRSLANYCFDLRFYRPRTEQIKAAMMTVCFREGIKVPGDALAEMIECSNHDVRQVLNHLSVWSAKEKMLGAQATKEDAERSKKDLKFGPWDVVRQVFTKSEQGGKSLNDKAALFFQDYSLGPLFVQENYLAVNPAGARPGDKKKLAELVSKTADSLCCSDIIEKQIRSTNAWGLLPTQAMFASVIPGEMMGGHFTGAINFPGWLGKNSKRNKCDRLLQELSFHMRLSTGGASKLAINEDYLELLKRKIFGPLTAQGQEGIPKSLGTLDAYYLLREDLESVIELTAWPHSKDADPMSKIESKVKAAFTRAYNKENRLNPYSQGISISKGRGGGGDNALEEDDEGGDVEDEEEEDEDVTKDNMIKVVQPKGGKKKDDDAGPSTSGRGGKGARGARGGGGGGGGRGSRGGGGGGRGRGRAGK